MAVTFTCPFKPPLEYPLKVGASALTNSEAGNRSRSYCSTLIAPFLNEGSWWVLLTDWMMVKTHWVVVMLKMPWPGLEPRARGDVSRRRGFLMKMTMRLECFAHARGLGRT